MGASDTDAAATLVPLYESLSPTAARVVVVPSEWYENNPMVIIESFCLSKPVIGANIGGIPESIKHGINGFMFTSGDRKSLESVLDEASKIKKHEYEMLSKSAENFARENSNQDNYYNELIKIYTTLL